MTRTQTYPFANVDLPGLAGALERWFASDQFETQSLRDPHGAWVVQARKTSSLREVFGMSHALTVTFRPEPGGFSVSVGQSKWADKAAATAIGLFLFAPAIVTAGIGLYQGSQLEAKVFTLVDQYLQGIGAAPGYASPAPVPEMMPCPGCNERLPLGAKFCPKCALDLRIPLSAPVPSAPVPSLRCAACEHELLSGARFCPSCGQPTTPAATPGATQTSATKTCACGTELPPRAVFCPSCGAAQQPQSRSES